MLEGLYRMTGQADNAAHGGEPRRDAARRIPPEVVTATGTVLGRRSRRWRRRWSAPICCKHGNHVEAMRLLARIGIAREVFDDAELLLEAVLELAPDYRAARHDYAEVLRRTAQVPAGAPRSSSSFSRKIRTIGSLSGRCMPPPASASASTSGPSHCTGSCCADARRTPDLHLSIAHALKTLGQREEAIESYRGGGRAPAEFRRCLLESRQPQDLSLHGRGARRACAPRKPRRRPALVDRYHLCFALGKALEDRGEYAESFRYYERGNALKRAESRYRPEIIENNTRSRSRSAPREFFAQPPRLRARRTRIRFSSSGCRAPDRRCSSRSWPRTRRSRARRNSPTSSGSSRSFRAAIRISNNPRYPRILAELTAEDFRQLGEKYLATTRASIARTSRSSSTRCRTTSGTSGSFI